MSKQTNNITPQNQKNQKATKFDELIAALRAKRAAEAETMISEMTTKELNRIDQFSDTALSHAAKEGLGQICMILIPLMTSQTISIVNVWGYTALHYSAREGLDEVCKSLIPLTTQDAINVATSSRCSPTETVLHTAAAKGMAEVCRLLIKHMPLETINAIDGYQRTALDLAVSKGHKEVAEILQAAIIDMTRQENTKTPDPDITDGSSNSDTEVINIFKKAIVQSTLIKMSGGDGSEILQAAIADITRLKNTNGSSTINVLQALITNSIDPDITDGLASDARGIDLAGTGTTDEAGDL